MMRAMSPLWGPCRQLRATQGEHRPAHKPAQEAYQAILLAKAELISGLGP